MNPLNSSLSKILSRRIPTIQSGTTIGKIEKLLFSDINKFDTINYIYIVDKNEILKGVLSIKELFRNSKVSTVDKVMQTNLITLSSNSPQEKAAYLALEHKLKEIPVVDDNSRLLGVINNENIMSITYKEAREDLLKLAGIRHERVKSDNIFDISLSTSVKHRLPWLFFGLLGGILAARIVNYFENTLEDNIILASFIPLIVYMGDAVGTQMEAFIIRDLAINRNINFIKYFFRHLKVLLIISAFSSTILAIISTFIYKDIAVVKTLSIALFCAIISSVVTGLFVPYTFSRFKLDPANTSGPIATIIQDILSIIIYFTIATIIIK